jgi:hypothetical protein
VQKKAKTITQLRRSDPCIDAAYTAGEKDTTAFDKLARFKGFLACYVGQLDRDPRQLCNVDKQRELARYTRGYFYVLGQAKEIGTNPALREHLELPPEIRAHIDPAGITTGYRDFAPNADILHGWKSLVKLGVFANKESLKELLGPEVPADVVEQLGAVQFVRPYCK